MAVAGGLADIANPVPIAVQAVVLTTYLNRMAEHPVVLAGSGNHDLDGPGAHGEQTAAWVRRPRADAVVTDGRSIDREGIRFTVCPWWDGPLGRDAVAAQLQAAAVDRPERWLWVYQAPPGGGS